MADKAESTRQGTPYPNIQPSPLGRPPAADPVLAAILQEVRATRVATEQMLQALRGLR